MEILFEIIGFAVGIPVGLFIGFYFFIYSQPLHIHQDPIVRPIQELDADSLLNLLPEIPLWVKNPDYDRVDWLNKFVSEMWPYLDKAICDIIKCTAEPIFAEYIGKYKIEAIEFDKVSIGTLPPIIHGLKIYESNERELVMEPAIKWAGNPNIIVTIKVLSMLIPIQLTELQIFAAPRITLKPLVPTFPCFASIAVSLMKKPRIDFGMNVMGGDIMSIPGLYRFLQDTIKKQVASLYLWPQVFDIPILDASAVIVKKPVGILHVKVVRAMNLLKKDILGTSDPYVKLGMSAERMPLMKTSVKKNNLNPEWNENFKLTVKEPESQILCIDVYDWDKVGGHDKLGMQVVPLKVLQPNERKELRLELLGNAIDTSDPQNKKRRGQIVIELLYAPFREESGVLFTRNGGCLIVNVQGAEDVEGKRHNNPYALLIFRGERKKTKMIRKSRNPMWNEEFQFLVEEAPVEDKIHIQIFSKKTGIAFRTKESLGHVEIKLGDVVHNGRINQKYHLIDSKKGVIHVELRWNSI